VCEPAAHISVFKDRSELEAMLEKEMPEGYHILLKGSRVMELERLASLLA